MLQKTQADELLKLIWFGDSLISGRASNLQRRFVFPGEAADYIKSGQFRVHKWELEELVNQFFTASGKCKGGHKRLDYTNFEPLRRLTNIYRGLNNAESLIDVEDIMDSMPRLFWPQASWQIGYFNLARTYRNLYVYTFTEASSHFKDRHGLSIERFYFLSYAFFAHCSSSGPVIEVAKARQGLNIPPEDMAKYLAIVAQTTEGMTAFARTLRVSRGVSAYKRSPIREYPVVKITSQEVIAPIPDLLLARATEGLYYDLVKNDNVRRIYGLRFESHCVATLKHFLPEQMLIAHDQEICKHEAPDIIIASRETNSVDLVVECKARRLPHAVLSSAKPQIDHEEAFKDLVKGVWQIWRFVANSRVGKAGVWSHAQVQGAGGLILTLDPWVQLGTTIIEAVINAARSEADRRRIDEQDRIPISFAAAGDLERTLQMHGFRLTCLAARRLASPDRHGYLIGTVADQDVPLERDAPSISPYPYAEQLSLLYPWWGGTVDRHTYNNLP